MATPGDEPTAAPAASSDSGGLQVTQEEINIIRARRAARDDSPSKTCKQEAPPTADEWKHFLEALAAKNFELGDLDPQLYNLLKTSKEARDDFLLSTCLQMIPIMLINRLDNYRSSIFPRNDHLNQHYPHWRFKGRTLKKP